jgi:hypothetical protein
MTQSSAIARSMRATGSGIGLVVGFVVFVSALCHLGQMLQSGSEHDHALSPSAASINGSEGRDAPAVGSESDGGGVHSCQHERPTAAHPQAPALTAVAKPAVLDRAPNLSADTFSPRADHPTHLPGPGQYVLCVMRT